MYYRPKGERVTRGGESQQARNAELKCSPAHDKGRCRGTLPSGERCPNPLPKSKDPRGPQMSLCEACQQRLAKDSGKLRSGQKDIY